MAELVIFISWCNYFLLLGQYQLDKTCGVFLGWGRFIWMSSFFIMGTYHLTTSFSTRSLCVLNGSWCDSWWVPQGTLLELYWTLLGPCLFTAVSPVRWAVPSTQWLHNDPLLPQLVSLLTSHPLCGASTVSSAVTPVHCTPLLTPGSCSHSSPPAPASLLLSVWPNPTPSTVLEIHVLHNGFYWSTSSWFP